MAEFWTSANRGNDINPGTYDAPFKSLARLITALKDVNVTAAGYVEQGYYPEGDINFEGIDNASLIGVGKVVWDCSGHPVAFDHFSYNRRLVVQNIEIKNFRQYLVFETYSTHILFLNCRIVYDKEFYGGRTTSAYNRITNSSYLCFEHCIFYGFDYLSLRYCYFKKCTFEPGIDLEGVYDYESIATSDTGYLDKGICINSGTDAPPFKDITVPNNPNLDYDEGHINFSLYAHSGPENNCIGTPSLGGAVAWGNLFTAGAMSYDFNISMSDTDIPSRGAWGNCDNYFDKTWEPINIVTGTNDTFQFNEGSGPVDATIAQGTYSSSANFASAIQDAIDNSLATDTHTILFGTNLRLDWSTNGASLTLNCNSYSTNDAWDEMGMDTSSDKSGTSRYYSDYPLCGGAVAGAEPDAGPVDILPDGSVIIDKNILPSATNADAVSPVLGFYEPKKIASVNINRLIQNNGEVDSTSTTTTRTIMVRANNQPFGMQDADGTTALDWIHVEIDCADLTSVADAYRYWQIRIRLRNNAA